MEPGQVIQPNPDGNQSSGDDQNLNKGQTMPPQDDNQQPNEPVQNDVPATGDGGGDAPAADPAPSEPPATDAPSEPPAAEPPAGDGGDAPAEPPAQ